MDERDTNNKGKSSHNSTTHETSNTGNNSLLSSLSNGYSTASKEFEKFFSLWGFYKRPTEPERKDEEHGKRKRRVDDDGVERHGNDNSSIYGRIIPDENRQYSFLRSTFGRLDDTTYYQTSASTGNTSEPPKKKQHTEVFGTTQLMNSTSSGPESSLMSPAKWRDLDQQEQERIARLKRTIESLESKSSVLQYPKPARTVRFSPTVEHASTRTSVEPPKKIPTGTTIGSLRLHENITKDPTLQFFKLEEPKKPVETTYPDHPLQPHESSTRGESPSFDSYASSIDPSVTPRQSPSETPRMPLKTPVGKDHKQSMALIIHQIPTVKLRRTDTIRGPDGQPIPNRFWNEIYNNGKNKSRPL